MLYAHNLGPPSSSTPLRLQKLHVRIAESINKHMQMDSSKTRSASKKTLNNTWVSLYAAERRR